MSQRLLVFLLVALVGGACGGRASSDVADEPSAVSAVTVERRDLVEYRRVTALIDFGETEVVSLQLGGMVTRPLPVGGLVELNSALVWINEAPVWLVEGSLPMYRELYRPRSGDRDEAGDLVLRVEGDDVRQVQVFLLELGFDDDGRLEPDGVYGASTESAVKALQESLNVPRTGRLSPGAIVFSSYPLRIADAPAVGEVVSELSVTRTERQIRAMVDPDVRRFFEEGHRVGLVYSSGTHAGTVASVAAVEGFGGGPMLGIDIAADEPIPSDAQTVVVEGGVVLAENVLAVPASALVALSEGGFAVEVVDGGLIAVEVGEQADGWIGISGDIDIGLEVLVP